MKHKFIYNAIAEQTKTYANELEISEWNDIINILRLQTNASTTYEETLHKWLFGEKDIYEFPQGLIDRMFDLVPTPTAKDAGKVLSVDKNGKYTLSKGGNSLVFVYDSYESFISSITFTVSEESSTINTITYGAEVYTASDIPLGTPFRLKEQNVPDYWLAEYTLPYAVEEVTEFFQPVGGSGGGGGGSSGVRLKIVGNSVLTVGIGADCIIAFNYYSAFTPENTATISINGIPRASFKIVKGDNTYNVAPFISSGTNAVTLKVEDASLEYTVSVVELKLSSLFKGDALYSPQNYINFIYKGAGEKTLKVFLDNDTTPYYTSTFTSTEGNTNVPFTNIPHGAHILSANLSTTLADGTIIPSNTLTYHIAVVVPSNNTPFISSTFTDTEVEQGYPISVDYLVYAPGRSYIEISHNLSGSHKQVLLPILNTRTTWTLTDFDAVEEGYISICITDATSPDDTGYDILVTKLFSIHTIASDSTVTLYDSGLVLNFDTVDKSNILHKNNWVSSTSEFPEPVAATFERFNWAAEGNGWADVDGRSVLRINSDAKVTIPTSLFFDNVTATSTDVSGTTIEIELESKDIYNVDNVLLRAVSSDNKSGIIVTGDTFKYATYLKNFDSTSYYKLSYIPNNRIKVSFVLEPYPSGTLVRLLLIYINGVLSGSHLVEEKDYLKRFDKIILNPDGNAIFDVYSIRMYNTVVSSNNIINNYIYGFTGATLRTLHARNNITDDQGDITYASVRSKVPTVVFTLKAGERLPTSNSKEDIRNITVSYYNPLTQDSFDNYAGVLSIQGTSSVTYPRKNWKVKYGDLKFSLIPGAIEESVYTFKADFMESSHSHNTGNARLIHALSPKTYKQKQNPDKAYRNTIDGFPVLLFTTNEGSTSYEYQGVYNYNNDKSNSTTLGLEEGEESWEFKDNANPLCVFDASTTSDYSNAFEARYPKESNYTNIKTVVEWVYTNKDDINAFKAGFENYFNLEFCLFYYIMMDVMLAVDSRAKNMFLDYLKIDESEYRWHPRWYDIDTTYGLNNVGVLEHHYYHDQTDPTDSAYAGERSNLWNTFEIAYKDEIASYYADMRLNDFLSPKTILKYLKEDQIDKISEVMYNTDGEFKYLHLPRTVSADNSEQNGRAYLYVTQGSRLAHLMWWLNNRFIYLDSKYDTAAYIQDAITFRMNTAYSPDYVRPYDITITPAFTMWAAVKYGNEQEELIETRKVKGIANIPLKIEAPNSFDPSSIGQEIYIYGASAIKDLGDLSRTPIHTLDISRAKNLVNLKIGSEKHINTSIGSLSIESNTLLENIDITNCVQINSLNISRLSRLKTLKASGTTITSIYSSTGSLTSLELPSTLTDLELHNQTNLSNITMLSALKLERLILDNCPNLNSYALAQLATNVTTLILTNVNWTVYSSDIHNLESIFDKVKPGDITGHITIQGQVATQIVERMYNKANEGLPIPVVTITAPNQADAYSVIFKDVDDNILYETNVFKGGTAYYGGRTPTYDPGDGIVYTFYEWDTPLINIEQDTIVRALFYADVYTELTLHLTEPNVLTPILVARDFNVPLLDKDATEEEHKLYLDTYGVTVDWGGTELLEGRRIQQYSVYPDPGSIREKLLYRPQSFPSTGVQTIKFKLPNTPSMTTFTNEYKSNIYLIDDYDHYTVNFKLQPGVSRILPYTLEQSLDVLEIPHSVYTGVTKIHPKTVYTHPYITSTDYYKGDNTETVYFNGTYNLLLTYGTHLLGNDTTCVVYVKDANKQYTPLDLNELYINTRTPCLHLTGIPVKKLVYTSDVVEINTRISTVALQSVVIEGAPISIGDAAFAGCTNLSNITIPDSVLTLGWHIFHKCESLSSITVPTQVQVIPNGAFKECINLQTILLPNALTTIEGYAFENCKALKDISIPEGVTSIGDYAFSECLGLSTINLPSTLTEIGYRAFYDCDDLTTLTIPDNVTTIDSGAFMQCDQLTSIKLPANLTEISSRLFSGTAITTITIPKNVTRIGSYAFEYAKVSQISIPNSVKTIESNIFYRVKTLPRVGYNGTVEEWMALDFKGYVHDNYYSGTYKLLLNFSDGTGTGFVQDINTSIDKVNRYVFNHVEGLRNVTLDTKEIGNCAFAYSTIETLTLYNTKQIGDYAFKDCSNLVQVQLPATLTHIWNSSFTATNIGTVKYTGSLLEWMHITKHSIIMNGSASFYVNTDELVTTVTIPTEFSTIPPYAFAGCGSLKSIVMHDDVYTISIYAFFDCTELTSITFSENLKVIYTQAFCGCAKLHTLIIPNTVTHIYYRAFERCNGLTEVKFPTSLELLDTYAFSDASSLTKVCLPASLTTIGSACFTSCSSLTEVELQYDVHHVLGHLFTGFTPAYHYHNKVPTTLTKVVLTNTTIIPDYMFYECANLTDVTIDNAVHIGTSAFYKCTGISTLIIPSSVTSMGENALWLNNPGATIYCNAVEPPQIYENTFDLNNLPTVVLPSQQAYDNYVADPVWARLGSKLTYE